MNALRDFLLFPWWMLVAIGNNFYNFWLYLDEVRRYYRYPPLLWADCLWMLEYALSNPFTLSSKATRTDKLPEDLTVYGETPWTTLEHICQAANLQADDHFVDLGCGTGRTLLFVAHYYHCRVSGYELIPRFVHKLRWLRQALHLETQLDIYPDNWLKQPLAGTVFLLVGTCYSDEHRTAAETKLRQLPSGTRIISISYPLQGLALQETLTLPFSWGKGTAYIQHVP